MFIFRSLSQRTTHIYSKTSLMRSLSEEAWMFLKPGGGLMQIYYIRPALSYLMSLALLPSNLKLLAVTCYVSKTF